MLLLFLYNTEQLNTLFYYALYNCFQFFLNSNLCIRCKGTRDPIYIYIYSGPPIIQTPLVTANSSGVRIIEVVRINETT